ncbi:hypothetical protein [Hansschlegelia sp.]|uniref:hypothetical protein n=1 Tax=Hansschlegelia sp. TaxID=2041892 RepID=UPI002BD5B2D6|nr:hypothetical protein [Hansschlegelia sp.]HVI29252.1 hypothetical protein [Hansschlegelia sp.]
MTLPGKLFRAALIVGVGAAGLQACGPYGPKGDRGLPPPPADLPYPNVYRTQPDAHSKLKTAEEQKRLQADLLAGKRQSRSSR